MIFSYGELDDGSISLKNDIDRFYLSNSLTDSTTFPTNRLFFEQIFQVNNANISDYDSYEDSFDTVSIEIDGSLECTGKKLYFGTEIHAELRNIDKTFSMFSAEIQENQTSYDCTHLTFGNQMRYSGNQAWYYGHISGF